MFAWYNSYANVSRCGDETLYKPEQESWNSTQRVNYSLLVWLCQKKTYSFYEYVCTYEYRIRYIYLKIKTKRTKTFCKFLMWIFLICHHVMLDGQFIYSTTYIYLTHMYVCTLVKQIFTKKAVFLFIVYWREVIYPAVTTDPQQ